MIEEKSFFSPKLDGISIAEIIQLTDANLIRGDESQIVYDVADLSMATSKHLAFVESVKWRESLRQTQAGVCIVDKKCLEFVPEGTTAILCHQLPNLAFAKVMRCLYPEEELVPNIHPTALVDPTAKVDPTATLGPGVVVGPGACIGKHTILDAYVVVGRNVVIGNHCFVGAHVSIQFSSIGHRVTLHPGVRLGQRGFGFAHGEAVPIAIPHIGSVVVEDDVEIGANTTVDRGKLGNTVIGRGTIIDNLVMIGHNVQIGKNCILCGQVGISGSTTLGDGVVMAGQVGVADHLSVGNKATIGAKSGLMHDVPDNEVFAGYPAMPIRQYMRQVIALKKLAEGKKQNKNQK